MSIDHVCVYCGILADTEDHVVPRHLIARVVDDVVAVHALAVEVRRKVRA